jgi:hypothetical protein
VLTEDLQSSLSANKAALLRLLVPANPESAGADQSDNGTCAKLAPTLDPRPMSREFICSDPRPDLVSDHSLWDELLAGAARLDSDDPNGVFGALHGIRCCGARLVPRNTAGWKLERGEMSPTEWRENREKWLMPHRMKITHMLDRLRAEQTRPQNAAPTEPVIDHFNGTIHDGDSVIHVRKNGYENAHARSSNIREASQGQYSTDDAQRLAVPDPAASSSAICRRAHVTRPGLPR